MRTDVWAKLGNLILNAAARMLVRLAGVVYVSVMTIRAAWSIVHAILFPAPAYA